MKQLIFLGLLLVAIPNIGSAKDSTVLVDGGHYDCLPVSIFGLKGVRLWQPSHELVNQLGEPKNIEKSDGEDDGGPYDILIYHYEGLTVEIVREVVDRIYTDRPITATPSGIRVGQSKTEVVNILGRVPRGWQSEGNKFTIVTCPVNGEWIQEDYVNFYFDEDNLLKSISYDANRP